ncbi:MAG TPA: hypothetical protein VF980_00095 [Thermoanaerobaculia bacterium]
MDPSLYRVETFQPHVNSRFDASLPDGSTLPLVLTEVHLVQSNEKVTQFSLLFRGPATPLVRQQTLRLDHAQLGQMDFFLVPIGADADGVSYEAVFSRFVSPAAR